MNRIFNSSQVSYFKHGCSKNSFLDRMELYTDVASGTRCEGHILSVCLSVGQACKRSPVATQHIESYYCDEEAKTKRELAEAQTQCRFR